MSTRLTFKLRTTSKLGKGQRIIGGAAHAATVPRPAIPTSNWSTKVQTRRNTCGCAAGYRLIIGCHLAKFPMHHHTQNHGFLSMYPRRQGVSSALVLCCDCNGSDNYFALGNEHITIFYHWQPVQSQPADSSCWHVVDGLLAMCQSQETRRQPSFLLHVSAIPEAR